MQGAVYIPNESLGNGLISNLKKGGIMTIALKGVVALFRGLHALFKTAFNC